MRRTTFPPDVAALIETRSDCQCEVWAKGCTYRMEHKHHRRVKGAGGSRVAETQRTSNGLACCSVCHAWIHAHPTEAMDKGWLVSQYRLPVSVPVQWRGQWRLLGDDGELSEMPNERAVR